MKPPSPILLFLIMLVVPYKVDSSDRIFAAGSECNPSCNGSDTCILIIQPATATTLHEGEQFELTFKVGGLDLADVSLCAENGIICKSILTGQSITVTGCTTSVALEAPSLSIFFADPPDTTVCYLRVSAYGGGPPYGEGRQRVVLKKPPSSVRSYVHGNSPDRTAGCKELFTLSGKRVNSNGMPKLTIVRDIKNRGAIQLNIGRPSRHGNESAQ